MQWQTQAGNLNTNIKVKLDSTLPEISVTKKVTWKYNVDDSTKFRYDIILGRYLLTASLLNIKFPNISLKQVEEL